MLSPRTLSLRVRNRSLLIALQNYSEKCADIKTNIGDESDYVHQGDDTYAEDFAAPNPLSSDHHQRNDQRGFHYAFQCKQKQKTSQRFLSENGLHEEEESKITEARNIKNSRRRSLSEPNSTTQHGSKSIFLEQQRAAEAQMHAPTHSHSMSKCYCITSKSIKPGSNHKYAVQLFTEKQHIPLRLKKQRYRADSLPSRSRGVRWADIFHNAQKDVPSSNIPESELFEKLPSTTPICSKHNSSPPTLLSNHSDGSCHSQRKLLDQVKTFRDLHWSECHALPRGGDLPEHECTQHYILNKRLFLESPHNNGREEHSHPEGYLPHSDSDQSQHSDQMQMKNSKSTSSCIMVTLPKLLLDNENLKSTLGSFIKEKVNKGHGPCFAITHHWQVAKQNSLLYPSDSLALRYQKRMC